MNKIFWSAFIGSNNLGDEAIFRSILSQIDIDKRQITALSVNEGKTQDFGVNTVSMKKFSDILSAIKKSDIVLVGGGGIIQDQSSIINFLYFAFQIWWAKQYDKIVILNFVGVGPIKFGLSKWIMRRIAPRIDFAIVRDKKSKLMLSHFGMKSENVYQAHDPVLNFPFQSSDLKEIYSADQPYAVLSLRRWFFTNPFLPVSISRKLSKISFFRRKYTDYMSKLATDLDFFLDNNKNMKIVAVSLYDGEDDVVTGDLVQMIKNKERVIVAENNMDEYEYLSVVKNSRFIIGMRLHSLILGSTLAKPFVALRYSTKVDEFTDQMGLTDISIHIENYDSKALRYALNEINIHHAKYSVIMKNTLDKCQNKNQKAFSELNDRIKKRYS